MSATGLWSVARDAGPSGRAWFGAWWLTAMGLLTSVWNPASTVLGADWPEFRGPGQQGHSTEINLPERWSETENIAWKTELPGHGWSSPAIVGRQIWLTTALEDGRKLLALQIDRETGSLQQTVTVFEQDDPGKIHKKNSHASPTPVIVGDRVYVHYGRHGTACLTTAGDIVWKTKLEYRHQHGPAGSPVVHDKLVIIACDGTDQQFVVGLDTATGKEVWRQNRGEGRMAYSTPTLIERNGQPEVISSGGEWTIAYHPVTGAELWRFRYPKGYSNVPRPVVGFGLTFVSSGYDTPIFYAVKLGGSGDVTESHLAWKLAKGAPRNASSILIGEELYLVNDNGIATCVEATTGTVHWQQRVPGDYSASPLFADGKLYLTNEIGKTTVLLPGKEFKVLAESEVPGRTLASLSTADGAIFQRTDTTLYRIQKPRP